ncbi:PAS domain-containing sensor histidine kinase [Myxococcota bacterium]|nr:PAS domain-containing sensor histidine kinase [Myxococcota bacterium]
MALWVLLLVGVAAPAVATYIVHPLLVSAGLPPDLSAALLLAVGAVICLVVVMATRARSRARIAAAAKVWEEMARGRPVQDLPEGFAPLWAQMRTVLAQLEVAGQALDERQSMQDVIDSMPDSLVVLDANGVVELCNRTFAQRTSYESPAEVVGTGLEGLVGEARPAWYATVIDTGELVAQDVRFRTKTGSAITLKTSGQVRGDGTGVVLVARDNLEVSRLTSELQRAAERLEDSERFFQDLFDAMEDPITVLSPQYEILQANRQARLVFGKDLIGRRCYRAFRMREEPCADCPARETFLLHHSTSVEHRIFGNAITRISTYPLLGKDGQLHAVINHKRDVTKERQLEDLKAGFLAAVSHELRTPLTSLMGFNKLNLRRLVRHVRPHLAEAPEEARTALQKVLSDMEVMASEGERLGRLVNDVLDLSKLEAGKLRLNFETIDVPAIVAGAVQATSTLYQGRHLLVVPDLPEVCPEGWGDRDRLSQVVVNLVSNAIKYTERGEIRIAVSVGHEELTVSVRDAGAGIPPDEVPRIFERFRQAGDAQKGRPAGTGLGLPICKELVHLHRGRIWVESTLGLGSTFSFTVRRADAVDPAERSLDLRGPSSLNG